MNISLISTNDINILFPNEDYTKFLKYKLKNNEIFIQIPYTKDNKFKLFFIVDKPEKIISLVIENYNILENIDTTIRLIFQHKKKYILEISAQEYIFNYEYINPNLKMSIEYVYGLNINDIHSYYVKSLKSKDMKKLSYKNDTLEINYNSSNMYSKNAYVAFWHNNIYQLYPYSTVDIGNFLGLSKYFETDNIEINSSVMNYRFYPCIIDENFNIKSKGKIYPNTNSIENDIENICNNHILDYKLKNDYLVLLYVAFDISVNNNDFEYFKNKFKEIIKQIDFNKTLLRLIIFGNKAPTFISFEKNKADYNPTNNIKVINKIIDELHYSNNQDSSIKIYPLKLIYESFNSVCFYSSSTCTIKKKALFFTNGYINMDDTTKKYSHNLNNANIDMFCISREYFKNYNYLENVDNLAIFLKDCYNIKDDILTQNPPTIPINKETSLVQSTTQKTFEAVNRDSTNKVILSQNTSQPVNNEISKPIFKDNVTIEYNSNYGKSKNKMKYIGIVAIIGIITFFINIQYNKNENVPVNINSSNNIIQDSLITTKINETNPEEFKYYKKNDGICIIEYLGNDTEIYLPEYIDSIPVTSMLSSAFNNNDNITKFIFNDNLTDIIIDAGSDMLCFDGFTNLKSVYFGSSINNIDEDYFDYCSSLESINVSEDNPYYTSQNGIVYLKDMSEIILCPQNYPENTLSLPDSVLSVANYCFEECKNINILYLNNVKAINNINFSGNEIIMQGDCIINSEAKLDENLKITFSSTPIKKNIDYCKSHNIEYYCN